MAWLRVVILIALATHATAWVVSPAAGVSNRKRMPHHAAGQVVMAAKKKAGEVNLNSRESQRERMDRARSNANVAVGRTDRKPKERAPGEMSGSNKMISFYGVVFAGLAAVSALGGGAAVISQ
mmetsp:Transcript_13265/g.23244  ORF Transcript_13265/g.23244 Transcript_13265/m.23244 type:complete len:123 (+) Transcript_13265:123-491(+)